ncbi:hypothetical protein SCP_0200540 [Sparassis crispa]|uniref:F-box domain-containing protein n=1 Tax=Sparassis crispa TaxID=139825 RepID=A0A401G9M4_9APHY|nr:hypothetical protein SCP_0200540 [Sparassis crispa]GBE78857.1 hypothetical protein SCP_0200540 [Sparassis crispa]
MGILDGSWPALPSHKSWAAEILLILAGKVPNVETLCFNHVFVVCLSLRDTSFYNVREFQRFLCAFPRLRDLNLSLVDWRSHLPADAQLGTHADLNAWFKLLLRSVIFDAGDLVFQPEILLWLISTPSTQTIRHLDTTVSEVGGPSPWGSILRALGGSLEHLQLNLSFGKEITVDQLNLANSAGLQALNLKSNQDGADTAVSSDILSVISQVSCDSCLQELRLDLRDPQFHSWQEMAALLSRAHFRTLRKIPIKYLWHDDQWVQHASWKRSVDDVLSNLFFRGVSVEYSVKRIPPCAV